MMQGNAILHWESFFLIFAVEHTENFSVRISSLVGTVVSAEFYGWHRPRRRRRFCSVDHAKISFGFGFPLFLHVIENWRRFRKKSIGYG